MVTPNPGRSEETVRWAAFPSWKQFTWLYMVGAMAALRSLVLLRSGLSGWGWWLGGAVLLVACAAILRRWARYVLTSQRVVVTNGYTGREIQSVDIDEIGELSIEQGPVARALNIGTVILSPNHGDQHLTLRGVPEPEVLKVRVNALREHPLSSALPVDR